MRARYISGTQTISRQLAQTSKHNWVRSSGRHLQHERRWRNPIGRRGLRPVGLWPIRKAGFSRQPARKLGTEQRSVHAEPHCGRRREAANGHRICRLQLRVTSAHRGAGSQRRRNKPALEVNSDLVKGHRWLTHRSLTRVVPQRRPILQKYT
jgi:hypothetical protein